MWNEFCLKKIHLTDLIMSNRCAPFRSYSRSKSVSKLDFNFVRTFVFTSQYNSYFLPWKFLAVVRNLNTVTIN